MLNTVDYKSSLCWLFDYKSSPCWFKKEINGWLSCLLPSLTPSTSSILQQWQPWTALGLKINLQQIKVNLEQVNGILAYGVLVLAEGIDMYTISAYKVAIAGGSLEIITTVLNTNVGAIFHADHGFFFNLMVGIIYFSTLEFHCSISAYITI